MPADSLVYTGHYIDHEIVSNIEKDCDERLRRRKDGEPVRILLTIGGAGAQRELFAAVICHLLPSVIKKKAALYINVGDYMQVWNELLSEISLLDKISTTHFGKWGAIHSAEIGDGTLECTDIPHTLQMTDLLMEDDTIFEQMYRCIKTNNSIGIYNGAYEAVAYILWGVTYTMMDIPYWSMIPAFTEGGKERENLTTLARSAAGVGSALVMVVTVIAVQALGKMFGGQTAKDIEIIGFRVLLLRLRCFS